MKKIMFSVLNIAFTAISTTTIFASRADMATYRLPVVDLGITLEPSKPGEPYFEYDGRGVRQGIISKVGNTYYMFYDGYGHHTGECDLNDPERHLCRALLAKSTDLKTWEKLGPKLTTGYDFDPTSSPAVYKDYWNAVSAWTYFNDEEDCWYLFYVGADTEVGKGDENVGIGGGYYSALVAKAKTKGIMGIEGDWQQLNQLPGQGKAVAVCDRINSAVTSSAGSVIQNPRWKGEGDPANKRYMMFVTRGDQVWLARSNTLGRVHDWDKTPDPDGWTLDGQILDKTRKTSPENATIDYDEKTGWYFLFTNQFSTSFTYTDCNIVYWTKDPNEWNPRNSATIIDRTTSKNGWATGAIGMASAVRINDDTFAVVYDASLNGSLGHPNRVIAMSHWKIPNLAEDGTVIGYKSDNFTNFIVNEQDGNARRYSSAGTPAGTFATGLGAPLGIAAGGGNIYINEHTGGAGGGGRTTKFSEAGENLGVVNSAATNNSHQTAGLAWSDNRINSAAYGINNLTSSGPDAGPEDGEPGTPLAYLYYQPTTATIHGVASANPNGFQGVYFSYSAGDGSGGIGYWNPGVTAFDSIATVPAGSFPRGLVTDGAGNLYFVLFGSGEIWKRDATGVVTTWKTGLNSPVGLATDAGIIYVGSYNGQTITGYSLVDGSQVSQFATTNQPQYFALVTLTAEPVLPKLRMVGAGGGTATLELDAAANVAYTMEFSATLATDSWGLLQAVPAGVERIETITDTTATDPKRFYRASVAP
jgi:hypothetical protein